MGGSCEITRLENSAGPKTPHFSDSILDEIEVSGLLADLSNTLSRFRSGAFCAGAD